MRNNAPNEAGLRREVLSFENLLQSFDRLRDRSERASSDGYQIAYTLCELYAMLCAFKIRLQIAPTEEPEAHSTLEVAGGCLGSPGELPPHGTVRKAAQALFKAVALSDKTGVSGALEKMGVLSLCPMPGKHFSKLELAARNLTGRAQLIPLLELSLFAAELGDYERARKYAIEAREFNPTAWEAHNLCVVEGLISLSVGNIEEAIQLLSSSINACQTDEYASLSCSVRAPNFHLAQKLLVRGHRVEVQRYLLECKNVWQLQSPQIDEWVSLLERGELPDLPEGVQAMNEPAYKLRMQWMTACALNEQRGKSTPPRSKSPAEVLAGRERLRAAYKAQFSTDVKSRIQYLEKDLDPSPEPPDSISSESEKPE
jgi:tetratricopeptide (TPR) repeat protein